MMSVFEQNIVSAVVIAAVIGVMSTIKDKNLKAMIYSLPLPITATLILVGVKVNHTNIIGLFLLNLFLWCVLQLNKKLQNIYLADIISTFLYIVIGYFLIQIRVPFYLAVFLYSLMWLLFVVFYKKLSKSAVTVAHARKVHPILKAVIVFCVALVLISTKSIFAGLVVTFPFSGVFAVVESKDSLHTLAAVFARNSLAILAMFMCIYLLKSFIASTTFTLCAAWVLYILTLAVVGKLVPLAKFTETN